MAGEQLFYQIQKDEQGYCRIQFWFDHVERYFSNECEVVFSICEDEEQEGPDVEVEPFSSWLIKADSLFMLNQLMDIVHKFVLPSSEDEEEEEDEVHMTPLLHLLEGGCQVLNDRRLNMWIKASEFVPGDLWSIDPEAITPSGVRIRTLALSEGGAQRSIAGVLAKHASWDLLRDWLSMNRPIIKDESVTAPEIITINMARKLFAGEGTQEI